LRSACLFVCLSVCSQNARMQVSPNFLYILPVAVARSSSDGSAICYVFPVLWMTSRCHILNGIGRIQEYSYFSYFSSKSPCGSTGGEVCHLRLHLVQFYFQLTLCLSLQSEKSRTTEILTIMDCYKTTFSKLLCVRFLMLIRFTFSLFIVIFRCDL